MVKLPSQAVAAASHPGDYMDADVVLGGLDRSSFMMISSMLVTSNAQTGCLLQVPLPYLSVPDAERLVFTAANMMP